jgi:hypothetical protein
VRNCSIATLEGKENVPPGFERTNGASAVGSLDRISFSGNTIISPDCFGITPGMAVTGPSAVGLVRDPDEGGDAGIRPSCAGAAAGGGLADLEKNFFKVSNMNRAGGDTARTPGGSSIINYNVFLNVKAWSRTGNDRCAQGSMIPGSPGIPAGCISAQVEST